MFPFWEPVIAPLLDAAGVRTLVEVGALRGDTTRQIVEHLGPEGVLHVIDPVPGFDPATLERDLPGRCVFHHGLSVDVLGDLPPVDAALIDGDHNWYTVTRELELLDATARAHGTGLPVLVLHDVCWPYGRRDLYYDPDTIPPEHRHAHARAGMRPGRPDLLPEGQGMGQGLWNAVDEGGARNGVMTALDDFVAASDRDLRVVVLPLYFGLGVVVEARRLTARPALGEALDRLEGAEGRKEQIELGERIRVRAVAHHHTLARRSQQSIARLAQRYLDIVERLLLTAGEGGLAELRGALDVLQADGPAGDVVVVTGDDPGPAVLACAHLAAFARDDRALWVLLGPGGDPGASEVALRDRLVALDLEGPAHVIILDAEDPIPARLPSGAALVYLAPEVPAPAATLDRVRRSFAPGGRVVDASGRRADPVGDPAGRS